MTLLNMSNNNKTMILPLVFLWWCSCVVVTIDAFTTTTTTPTNKKTTGVVTSPSALYVSVVSKFLTKDEAETKISDTFENQTPDSVGMNDITAVAATTENDQQQQQEASSSQILSKRGRRRNRRKHNYSQQRKFLKEKPDLDFYTLHSSAVSHLERDTPINDIIRAIKRAQNLHDVHDLGTIAGFLIDECGSDDGKTENSSSPSSWGYGFRGSLLSRVAVAALHMKELDIAIRAIETRRVYERPSMQPYESAAIVRGLMRMNEIDKAWIVLEDELRLPMDGTDLTSTENGEILKHRAQTLASIASRHFYNGRPSISAKALQLLGTLGPLIEKSNQESIMDMPWNRLINAAADCKVDDDDDDNTSSSSMSLPSDLTELVFAAMSEFPCPGGEEECSLEDFLE